MIGWLLMAYKASGVDKGGLFCRSSCCFQPGCWCIESSRFWRLFDEAERVFSSPVTQESKP